jgi:hypothetical protein
MKISRLLLNEDKWTKNALARKKDGTPIPSLNIIHKDGKEIDPSREAVCWSLYGAIVHLYNGDGQQEVFLKLGDIIRKYKSQKIYLAQFNDSSETSFEDIQAVLELANL